MRGCWNGRTKRVMSVHLPMWSIDLTWRRIRRPRKPRKSGHPRRNRRAQHTKGAQHNRPAMVLIGMIGDREIVAQRCEQCAATGVQPGMTLSHARALLAADDVCVERYEPERDAAALRALAVWATRFCPIVAPDPPNGLLLNITGCERLYHGEARMAKRLGEALNRLGFRTQIAVASTFAAAWALASFDSRNPSITAAGDEHDALAPLPIQALNLDDETLAALDEVNVSRVEHLLNIPRNQLAARFNPDVLLRLDQALGQAMETIDPVRPESPLRVERQANGAVTQLEAIEQTVHELLGELIGHLYERERGVVRLDVQLDRLQADPQHCTITLSNPSRHHKHLWSLLRPRLETINLGFGVERLVLTATRSAALPHAQHEQWTGGVDNARRQQAHGELLDTLANRLTPQRVQRLEPRDTHIPERTFQYRPATERASARTLPVAPPRGDRPSLLYDPPKRIEVLSLTPDGIPKWLCDGEGRHVIIHSIGPERLSPQWWRRSALFRSRGSEFKNATRDYFKVQDERGHWLWVFRAIFRGENDQWFVHGEWA